MRILIAGGGTGDAIVYYAEMCTRFVRNGFPYACGGVDGFEIYHVDLSEVSISIAKERLKVRGLEGAPVFFIQGSLLDLSSPSGRLRLNLPSDILFDYINTSGVLHHLSSPPQGLSALKSVLTDGGSMFVMVYGEHGRTGVYDLQQSVRSLVDTVADPQSCITIVKQFISAMPPTHRLSSTIRSWMMGAEKMEDVGIYREDSEIYDIFCHSQDKAYNVESVFEFIYEGGEGELAMASWQSEVVYDPSTFYGHSQFFLDLFAPLEKSVKKFALAEKAAGSLHSKHSFLLTKDSSKKFPQGTYIGRPWNPAFDEVFASEVLCTSLEESILDYERSMWDDRFQTGWIHDESAMCRFSFDVAAAGRGFDIVETLHCSVLRVVSLLDCKRTVADVVNEVVRLEGLGSDHWWMSRGFRVVYDMALTLQKNGLIVPLPGGNGEKIENNIGGEL